MVRLRVTGAFLRNYHGIPVPQGQVSEFDEDRAKRAVSKGIGVYVEAAEPPQPEKQLDDMTVDELRSYAAENDINLHGATTKADIRTAIELAAEEAQD
jgi:hypothetical protein